MSENNELVQHVETSELQMVRQPEAVIAEARKAAVALQTVIASKPKHVMLGNEQYIEFEDWQLLGRFYGYTVKITSTTPVEVGNARGYESTASIIDVRTGIEVSSANAMCLNDEEKWSVRTKYEYKNGVKVAVGTASVPMFQLRSMSQTRAGAKAFRNILSWVVVLAGYKAGVAEEMTGDEEPSTQQSKPPIPIPQPVAGTPTPPAPASQPPTTDKISAKQNARFYAIAKSKGKTDAEIKTYLKSKIGSEDSRSIPWRLYNEICLWADPKLNDESPMDEAPGDSE